MVALDSIALAIVSGIANGMLLFFAAVGLTLIFGALYVLNFAHGSLYMLGAYFAYFLDNDNGFLGGLPGSFWLAVLIAPLLVALVGVVLERFVIRPVYDQDHEFQLLLTFGLVLVIDNGARILWGTNFRSVSPPELLDCQVTLFWERVPIL